MYDMSIVSQNLDLLNNKGYQFAKGKHVAVQIEYLFLNWKFGGPNLSFHSILSVVQGGGGRTICRKIPPRSIQNITGLHKCNFSYGWKSKNDTWNCLIITIQFDETSTSFGYNVIEWVLRIDL